MKRRVVITGLGAVTPIGNTVEEFWNGVHKGACGIGTITKFDTAEYKVHLAGEVKGFVAKERMDSRRQDEWELSHSMPLRQQKKRLQMPAFPWRMKIRSASAFWWAPVSVI